MSLPRLNALRFWLLIPALSMALLSFILSGGSGTS
jgi:heme/copper-type cytochrome/quinol oxidase subunit 1